MSEENPNEENDAGEQKVPEENPNEENDTTEQMIEKGYLQGGNKAGPDAHTKTTFFLATRTAPVVKSTNEPCASHLRKHLRR